MALLCAAANHKLRQLLKILIGHWLLLKVAQGVRVDKVIWFIK